MNCLFTEPFIDYQTDEPKTTIKEKSNIFLILGGNLASWKDSEILDISRKSVVCTKPADIPEKFSKSAVGAYLDKRVMLCGGWLAGKECGEYEFDTQQWSEVPYSLNIERAEAAGAILHNGSWIIIGGKGPDGEPLFSTDFLHNGLFEPNLQWPEAVSGQCVAGLNSSHLLVSGGESKGGNLLGTVYFLNVDTSLWISLEEKMEYSRRGHVCGIATNDDKEYIIIAGGQDILKTELLDLKTMRFKLGPDLPFEMDWAASIQTGSNFAVVGGEHIGYCSKPSMCISSNALFEIAIENNTWNILDQSLKLPRSKHIIVAIGSKDISNGLCQKECPTCKGETNCPNNCQQRLNTRLRSEFIHTCSERERDSL